MSLLDSLLGAIIRLDGDCLVLHTGEKPYVVTSSSSMNAFRGPLFWGQVELSTRLLTPDALAGMLDHFLSEEQRGVLADFGAVENVLPATADRPAFTVIAARGGDDIWVEIKPVKAAVQEAEAVAAEPAPEIVVEPASEAVVEPVSEIVVEPASEAVVEPVSEAVAEPAAEAFAEPVAEPEPTPMAQEVPTSESVVAVGTSAAAEEETVDAQEPEQPVRVQEPSAEPQAPPSLELVPDVRQQNPDEEEVAELLASSGLLDSAGAPLDLGHGAVSLAGEEATSEPVVEEAGLEEPSSLQGPELEEIGLDDLVAREQPSDGPGPAVVLPLSRSVRQAEVAPAAAASPPDVERLLRVAAARGASGLYLVAQSRPTVRVDGEMQQLDAEEPLSAADVEAFMLALAPDTTRDAVQSGEAAEWFREVEELGRVRCLSFRDHRGPGVIIRMLPARAISAEQLGLSKDIQALCAQPDGLVLVAGPRASGKSTLLAAFVDMINRTRADHLITIERQITFVHESRRSFVSQREVRGEAHEVLAAVRSALREDPDVLVVEELRSPEVVAMALEAAESGRLVLAGLRAPSSAQAIERLVSQVPVDRRADALTALSLSLRGVVSQVLLRKRGGGRIAARELLLNTPAAASVIADGKLFQLPAALESGRKLGSVALNDTLAALIRDGVVDAGEAWRKASDRDGLLALLKREGVDTSFVERLA